MPAVLRAFAKSAGIACLVFLAGCGGSGSTSGSLTWGNRYPDFTSPSSVSVLEDTSGVFYNVTAVDPDGDPVSYSIQGGEDRSAFRITSGGALSFVTPPDFENPADVGGNNVYRVVLGAHDGTFTATLELLVTVTDRASAAFRVRRVASALASPVFAVAVPDGSNRVFVGELTGRIHLMNLANGLVNAEPFLDLRGQLSTNGERGLLGFATAPDFATTGAFYVFVTDPVGTIEVRRYRTFTTNREVADPATREVILRQPHPRINHNGGWIAFGPEGALYVSIGDGGGAGDPDDNAQDTNTWLGKILRIDVTRDDFPNDAARNYGIPAGNPFVVAGGAPEIWAYGLRNVFRASFDSGTGGTGVLLLGDVGQDAIEEIDLMTEQDGGANFGWSIREGTQFFEGADSPAFTPPVAEYRHGTGTREGDSVTGGVVYRGPVEALRGQYLFADFVRGNVWSIPLESLLDGRTVSSAEFTVRNADFAPDAGDITNPVSFGTDQAGNVLIVDLDGELFILEAAPTAAADRPRPASAGKRSARQHFCAEEWDGHTVRWRRGEIVLGGEGFTCVRKHYEARRKAMAARENAR